MRAYGLKRQSLRAGGFFDTALARRLAEKPVGLIDVGARWGISEDFVAAAPLFAALAIEPDQEEAARVAETGRSQDWASFEVEPAALGREFGELKLNVYSRPNNSSIYRVSEHAKQRYRLGGFDLVKVLRVPAKPLDAIVFDTGAPASAGEVVKLDVQGAEMEVIAGASRMLRERTICLIVETHFFELYQGAPFFAEIDQCLRKLGFTFIGFSDFQFRSTKRFDKRRHWGRERMLQADAYYFRDPLAAAGRSDGRASDVAILLAVLLGYFDLAAEWVAGAEAAGRSGSDVIAAIDQISRVRPDQVRSELVALLAAVDDNPDFAHVLAGKFVDARRDLTTFHELPDAAPKPTP